mmetsp:Transcript_11678/g.35050  ORF Transcript_11678/g.35050 Transcript_11678/m.35050 type:complete len:214 (-) Transcript_11678:1094-1735(-)
MQCQRNPPRLRLIDVHNHRPDWGAAYRSGEAGTEHQEGRQFHRSGALQGRINHVHHAGHAQNDTHRCEEWHETAALGVQLLTNCSPNQHAHSAANAHHCRCQSSVRHREALLAVEVVVEKRPAHSPRQAPRQALHDHEHVGADLDQLLGLIPVHLLLVLHILPLQSSLRNAPLRLRHSEPHHDCQDESGDCNHHKWGSPSPRRANQASDQLAQ